MLLVLALALFGVLANGLCLASIGLQCPGWHQNHGLIIIFSLAVNDFVFCLQQNFTALAELVPRRMLPSLPAVVAYAIAALVIGCDLFEMCHLIVMAANRFAAIVTPLHYAELFTPARTRKLCVFGWLFGASYSLTYFLLCRPALYSLSDGGLVPAHEANMTQSCSESVGHVFQWCFVSLFFACLLVSIAAYVPVTVQIYRIQHNPASQIDIEVTVCIQFLLVVGIWFMAFVGYGFFAAVGYIEHVAHVLGLLTFASNPVIYWFFNETIRNGFNALWKKNPPVTNNIPIAEQPVVNPPNGARNGRTINVRHS